MVKAIVFLKNIVAFGLVFISGIFAYWYIFDLPVKVIGETRILVIYVFTIFFSLASAIGLFRSKQWGLYFLSCLCLVWVFGGISVLVEGGSNFSNDRPQEVFLFFLLFTVPILIPSIFWVFRKRLFF